MNQKHLPNISSECKCKFDGKKCNSNQWWNNDKCWCEYKNYHICEKDYVSNSATCNCENGKYLASIMYDSAIICDEIIKSYHKEIRTIPTNFNKKISLVKHKVSIFYLPFY